MSAATNSNEVTAVVSVSCADLDCAQRFYVDELGFRLKCLVPADAPRLLRLEGHGITLELRKNSDVAESASTQVEAHRLEITEPVLTHPDAGEAWSDGRAGMHYRDLVPTRLGGALIASHIRIPHGGPVPDYVHYHDIDFQLIYCLSGWVRLLYEDQGDAFVMHEGDCVVQPPGLRHRVLECSDRFDVVEFSSPAEHMTWVDHDLELPNGRRSAGHRDGQTFLHFRSQLAAWDSGSLPGWRALRTGTDLATGGKASLTLLATGSIDGAASSARFRSTYAATAGVVTRGSAELQVGARRPERVAAGSAFACAGEEVLNFDATSADFTWLALEFG